MSSCNFQLAKKSDKIIGKKNSSPRYFPILNCDVKLICWFQLISLISINYPTFSKNFSDVENACKMTRRSRREFFELYLFKSLKWIALEQICYCCHKKRSCFRALFGESELSFTLSHGHYKLCRSKRITSRTSFEKLW